MWQPIETAKRDGRAVWLLVDGHPYIGYGLPADILGKARWVIKATFRRVDGNLDEIYGCYGDEVEPTHWQELPNAD